MNPNEKAIILNGLSATYRGQFLEGRKYEWKVFFTPISFYVLTIVAVYQKKFILPDIMWFKTGICVIFLLLLVFTLFYLGFVHMALNRNKEIAENCEDIIQNLINGNNVDEIDIYYFTKYWISWKTYKKGKAGREPYLWQSCTLITFCIGCIVLIYLL